MDIRVKIDRKTGRATFARIRTVVEDDAGGESPCSADGQAGEGSYLADPQIGDEVIDEVPPVDLGRIAAQSRQAGDLAKGP